MFLDEVAVSITKYASRQILDNVAVLSTNMISEQLTSLASPNAKDELPENGKLELQSLGQTYTPEI